MHDVAILADDLTGALDTGAVFATVASPVVVTWQVTDDRRLAVDSATREVAPAQAAKTVGAFVNWLAGARIAFKKVDSLLRGNSFIEIATLVRSRRFQTICLAPAFPAQGRTTVGGVVRVADAPRVALIDGLAAEGVAATLLAPGDAPHSPGVFVCDASTTAHVSALAEKTDTVGLLWCGSSGLARALAPPPQRLAPRVELVVIGSRHDVSRAHAAQLFRSLGPAAVRVSSLQDVDAVRAALVERTRAALIFDLPPMSPAAAEQFYRDAFAVLVRAVAPPAGIAVVGGDTLFRLARTLGATGFDALGEFAEGVPVSSLRGGRWPGCTVISKSGAFADAGLFTDFADGERQSA